MSIPPTGAGSSAADRPFVPALAQLELDGLASHLEETYGQPVQLEALDHGVFRVERGDGSRWVARVFPSARPLTDAQEDATILDRLERGGFPAEQCADPEPVSEFRGQPVLVTGFLEATQRLRGRPVVYLGAMLGRLHARPVPDCRPGGAWHHVCFRGTPRDELAAVDELLEDHLSEVPLRHLATFDRIREAVAGLDGCEDLPDAFVHPDFVPSNAIPIAEDRLAIVDWTGSGSGPRLWSLGFLLWAAGARDVRLVDAVVPRYRKSIELEPGELDRLRDAIRGRPVVLEAWAVAAGRRDPAAALEHIEDIDRLATAISARAGPGLAGRQ